MPSRRNSSEVVAVTEALAPSVDATEIKLKALHSLHSGKVKALLTQVGRLQKENVHLKRFAQDDSTRSEFLRQSQEELGHLDVINSCLLQHVRKEGGRDGQAKLEKLIHSALNPSNGICHFQFDISYFK